MAVPGLAAAQPNAITYDETYLTSLYKAQLQKATPDAYVEKLITEERLRIRKQADQEVQNFLVPSEQPDVQDTTATTATTAVDRQRTIVTSLQEQMRERTVDLDLLNEEEKKYYPAGGGTVPTSPSDIRLTTTHQQLLAKQAILEERIAAYDAALSLQQDRLNKLTWDQRMQEFGTLFHILTYVAILAGAVILDRLVKVLLVRRSGLEGKRYMTAKFVGAGIYLAAFLWVISRLLTDNPQAAAALAIIGAGIAVALQDIVRDVMGWIIILQRRLFRLGNRVTIGPFTGDVIDIGLLRITMLEVSANGVFNAHERTGKILHVPNGLILREPVLNYHTTSDFMNVEMRVTVSYESDWRKAEAILHDILHKEAALFVEPARMQEKRRTALFYATMGAGEPSVDTDVGDSGIVFTLSFTVPIGKRRGVVTELSKAILARFGAEKDIDLAFNTIRVVGGEGERRARRDVSGRVVP